MKWVICYLALLSLINFGFTCTLQSDCAINSVCDNGNCRGIQGATCDVNTPCSSAYNCISGTCLNAASNAVQTPSSSSCNTAPTLKCDTTYSIALRESNSLTAAMNCVNPSTSYNAGTLVAYFFMPPINITNNDLNVTFTVPLSDPNLFNIHVLTGCSGNFCDRPLPSVSLGSNLYSYNHNYDYGVGGSGIIRGYAIVYQSGQLDAPNGLIVNVTTRCPYTPININSSTTTAPLSCANTGVPTEIYENHCTTKCPAIGQSWNSNYGSVVVASTRMNLNDCFVIEEWTETDPYPWRSFDGTCTSGKTYIDGWCVNPCSRPISFRSSMDKCRFGSTYWSYLQIKPIATCDANSQLYGNPALCYVKCPTSPDSYTRTSTTTCTLTVTL